MFTNLTNYNNLLNQINGKTTHVLTSTFGGVKIKFTKTGNVKSITMHGVTTWEILVKNTKYNTNNIVPSEYRPIENILLTRVYVSDITVIIEINKDGEVIFSYGKDENSNAVNIPVNHNVNVDFTYI